MIRKDFQVIQGNLKDDLHARGDSQEKCNKFIVDHDSLEKKTSQIIKYEEITLIIKERFSSVAYQTRSRQEIFVKIEIKHTRNNKNDDNDLSGWSDTTTI